MKHRRNRPSLDLAPYDAILNVCRALPREFIYGKVLVQLIVEHGGLTTSGLSATHRQAVHKLKDAGILEFNKRGRNWVPTAEYVRSFEALASQRD